MVQAPPKLVPVLMNFKTSLGFKVTSTPGQRKAWASFVKFRNWKEKNGSPIRFSDSAAIAEINVLRERVNVLERRIMKRLEMWKVPEAAE